MLPAERVQREDACAVRRLVEPVAGEGRVGVCERGVRVGQRQGGLGGRDQRRQDSAVVVASQRGDPVGVRLVGENLAALRECERFFEGGAR